MQGIAGRRHLVIARRERILAPFPDIACDVAQAKTVRREGVHWRGAGKAVIPSVAVREIALPDVAAILARRRQFVAPGKDERLRSARGIFPLRFGGQRATTPIRVGFSFIPVDADARLIRDFFVAAMRQTV